MPVIHARPENVGHDGGRSPTSVVSSSRPVNRVPMNDSFTNSVPQRQLTTRVQLRHPRAGAGAARRAVEPAGVDRHRVARVPRRPSPVR